MNFLDGENANIFETKTCCFTGNRPHKLPWGTDENDERCLAVERKLLETLEKLVLDGYDLFVCGMAQGGDMLFARVVLSLKEKYPQIKLECALPCPEQTRGWSVELNARYNNILNKADIVTMVSEHYSKWCMFKRNRYMVDKSSVLVSLCFTQSGGTVATRDYAIKKGLKVIDLA